MTSGSHPHTEAAGPGLANEFTAAEVSSFQEQGFLVVPGLAPEFLRERMLHVTLDGIARRIEPLELEAELQYPGAPQVTHEGAQTIRRLKQAFSRDASFLEWMQYPPLRTRLKQLLGEQVVCPLAHHNCIMTKEPRFSSDTGWHQDIRYWSFQKPELISVWLALGMERQENGCLQVIPGSHRVSFPPSSFDQDLFFRVDWPENEPYLQQRQLVELNPGDVLFFHARTLHAATRNYSPATKYSAVFTFRSSDNPPLSDSRSSRSPELLLH